MDNVWSEYVFFLARKNDVADSLSFIYVFSLLSFVINIRLDTFIGCLYLDR